MATQPNRQHGKPLPMGLAKSGLIIWNLLSEKQQKTAKEYGIFDAEYYTRFCKLVNYPGINCSLIEKGGIVSGLNTEGKKIWELLNTEIQIEVFITSANGKTPSVATYINAAWKQLKIGNLTRTQIEHDIQTLTSETDEIRHRSY
jgi:hypothetical protein